MDPLEVLILVAALVTLVVAWYGLTVVLRALFTFFGPKEERPRKRGYRRRV